MRASVKDKRSRGTDSRRVALVAAHFTPGNLTAVHRSRFWAQSLPDFGWEPVVVTTHWKYYEEALDWDLHGLVSPDLEVIRTRAIPTSPVRIVGDIGIRGFYWHYRALASLAREGRLDFIHITIPSNFSALLGRLIYRRYGTPYGIDYIDPWVQETDLGHPRFSKASLSSRLARILEPWAVRDASLITGVASSYYESVLERNPHLRTQAVTVAMPYGGAESDYQELRRTPRPTFLFDPNDGRLHLIYAGAMLPLAYSVLEVLFQSLVQLRSRQPGLIENLRIHFVGTGKSPNDSRGFNIRPYIEKFGLEGIVDEHPHRIPYVDVLNHLNQSSGILILGSTEPHYTPSKVFQAVLSRKPIFAMLQLQSTATSLIRESRTGVVCSFEGVDLPPVAKVAQLLGDFVSNPSYSEASVQWELFDGYSARHSTRQLARGLNEAVCQTTDRRDPKSPAKSSGRTSLDMGSR